MLPTRRWLYGIGLGLFGAFVAIQLVPYGRNHVNPPTVSEPSWDSAATRALAKQACFDCHSNETEWPAYARIAPVSWLIQRDVVEGRAVLNFSEWQRPQEKSTDTAEELLEGEMPPAMYRLMHAHARLNDADRDRLARGLAKTLGVSHQEGNGAERERTRMSGLRWSSNGGRTRRAAPVQSRAFCLQSARGTDGQSGGRTGSARALVRCDRRVGRICR